MLPVIMGHTPAGASSKQFLHYAQNCVMSKFVFVDIRFSNTIIYYSIIFISFCLENHFREWDYVFNNYKRYNRMTPPDYPLKNVNAPVALFYSNNDWMSAISVRISKKKISFNLDCLFIIIILEIL